MTVTSSSLERRLRALEAERSSRHPDRLLVLLGTSSAGIAAQFAKAVAEGRADSDEPYDSILMVPGTWKAAAEMGNATAH
jgi:chloramphenicol 3-O-phosphotransferase